MEIKALGKITKVRFGFGGYQEAQFGLWLLLQSRDGGSVWAAINGGWSTMIEHTEHAKWTEADRSEGYDEMTREIQRVMRAAKVDEVHELLNKPVEIITESMALKSWRVLEEVL